MARLQAALALLLILSACAGDQAPPSDLIAVPTQPDPGIQLGPVACPMALLEGELVADDEVGFVVRSAHGGGGAAVTWPHGYVARDAERRELLDAAGRVVAREGDHVALGGGSGPDGRFAVCGQLDVTSVD